MDNEDLTNHPDEPSLGDDILEQMRAQGQPSAVPQENAQNSPPEEEEEAWWLKYVQEPEGKAASPPPEPEEVVSEASPVSPDPVAPQIEVPEVPSQLRDDLAGLSPAQPTADSPESPKIPIVNPVENKVATDETQPLPPPPKQVQVVPAALPPISKPPESARAALPLTPLRNRSDPKVRKSPSKRDGKAVVGRVTGAVSGWNAGLKRITPRVKSVFKLWPFTAGALVVIAAIIFVPFTFVPEVVVEGKVEEEEQSLLAAYSGKVETIFVQKWDRVQAGEPLIKLQSDHLEEEIQDLNTKLQMRYEGLFQEYQGEMEKLNRIIVKAEIDYKALVSENQAIDRQIKNLNAYLGKKDEDPEKEPAPVKQEGIPERISVLSADYARNESKITKASGEIATAESDIRKLMTKVRDLQEKESLDLANLEEENKYRNLLGKSDQLILKAPTTGSISELQFKEGQSVREGDTILRIVSDPDRIKIRIPEERIKDHAVGDYVWIKDSGKEFGFLKVPITLMSPKINSDDISQEPGRSVFLSYPPGSALLPGQKVLVQLNDPEETGLQSVHRKITRKFDYAKRREQESQSQPVLQ